MTAREFVVYFTLNETYESICKKIADSPHNKFPVCDRDIDHVIGYVDSKIFCAGLLKDVPFL